MAYGLPAHGEPNWDTKLTASIEALHDGSALDGGVAAAVSGGPQTQAALSEAIGELSPETYGAVGDGTTDDTTAMNAVWAAGQATGRTVKLTAGKTYLCLGALAPTYTGTGTSTLQKPLRVTGPGQVSSNGYWASNPLNGGATLDLRYDGTGGAHPAKIDTRGAGAIEIDHINLISGGTDDFPIFQTTNTQAHIHHNFIQGNTGNTGSACKQDAIFFGGTTNTVGNTADAPFQGYGGSVHDNYFSHIRRAFVGRTYCNSIPFTSNTISTTCGNDGTGTGNLGGAYELHGRTSTDFCVGNIERGNTIECSGYKYAVALENAVSNAIGPSGYWDAGGPYVSAIYLGAASNFNTVTDGYHTTTFPLVSGPSKMTATILTGAQSRLSYHPQYTAHRGQLLAINQYGQGFSNMATSGDASKFETVAGNAGSPSYPTVNLLTAPAKSVADVVTTSGSTVITSASAGWLREHEYMPIKGAGIPSGTLISRWISSTSVELSAAATATATGVTVQYGHPDGEMGAAAEIGFSRRHILTKGAIGTATPLAGVDYNSATAAGTDGAFRLTAITAATTPAAGDIAVIAAGITWTSVPRYVITPRNAAAAAVMASIYLPTKNDGNNTYITTATPLTPSTTYIWDFIALA